MDFFNYFSLNESNYVSRTNASSLRPPSTDSAIMQSLQSLDSPSLFVPSTDHLSSDFHSLKITDEESMHPVLGSFLLLDGQEQLHVKSSTALQQMLEIANSDIKIKVVSIFGNAGDGKSHTLNELFFQGREIFGTGSEQGPRTLGVWAAWDPTSKALILDTEGLQGVAISKTDVFGASHDEQRTRLLLKVLAISDVVLYRTKSERLGRDLYSFLGSASRAYIQHFNPTLLKNTTEPRRDFVNPGINNDIVGPALIISQETKYTKILESSVSESPEDIIRQRFNEMGYDIKAFSSLRYVGVQSGNSLLSSNQQWNQLKVAVRTVLEDTTIRPPRDLKTVFESLRALNDKFSGTIPATIEASLRNVQFPDQYFTCGLECDACQSHCTKSMGHLQEGIDHNTDNTCKYQQQYDNCVFLCKICKLNGKEIVVTQRQSENEGNSWFGGIMRYAWSGYIIDCPNCGEIYRSREYWYGNQGLEDSAKVIKKIVHIWPGMRRASVNQNSSTQISAQRVIDGMSYITEAVANVGIPPTKAVTSWIADQIAPKYWRPNNEIKNCCQCKRNFTVLDTIHHCRACGEGVCDGCSQKKHSVPERGWDSPVRVCDTCFLNLNQATKRRNFANHSNDLESEIRTRRYGEAVVNTISSFASAAIEYPKDFIKETARPAYWQPDSEAFNCVVCKGAFGIGPEDKGRLHHCRACGKAVCDECSRHRQHVPEWGWTEPVRVCNTCFDKRNN